VVKNVYIWGVFGISTVISNTGNTDTEDANATLILPTTNPIPLSFYNDVATKQVDLIAAGTNVTVSWQIGSGSKKTTTSFDVVSSRANATGNYQITIN
jgi:hypothetical protein